MVMIPRSTIRLVSVFVLGYSIIVSWFLFQSTNKYYIFDNSNHETHSVRNLTSWRAWEGEILPLRLQCNPTFSRLSTSTEDLFLTSAFGIHYLAQVWVIVIINSDLPVQSDFECVFYKQDQNDLLSWNYITNFSIIGLTLSKLYVFPEIVKLPARFTAAIFSCPLRHGLVPDAVSLVPAGFLKLPVHNALPVISPSQIERNFAVCVSPLHSLHSKAHQIVEMVETSLVLGADHFFFYNLSIHWNVDAVLNHYASKGLVTVIQWPLPAMLREDATNRTSEETNIHYHGQLAMLNDCLNRNKGASRYVVFQDLDELVVPKKHQSWTMLMASLPSNASAYMLRSSYFPLDWPSVKSGINKTANKIAKTYNANAFLKVFREERIFGRAVRSKYIVDPLRVEIVGIHNVWKFKRGGAPYYVPPEVALVHHYRAGKSETELKRVKDKSVFKFIDALPQIHRTWQQLGDIPLGPLV
ncbi:uncharacterized protein LOC111128118 isoform X1 [Crassostrea virginica]